MLAVPAVPAVLAVVAIVISQRVRYSEPAAQVSAAHRVFICRQRWVERRGGAMSTAALFLGRR